MHIQLIRTNADLSPSFNWRAAGLNDQDMKEYVWKLGKLGFMCVSILLASWTFLLTSMPLQLAIHHAGRSAYQCIDLEPLCQGVCCGRHEGLHQSNSRKGIGGGMRSRQASSCTSFFQTQAQANIILTGPRFQWSGAEYADALLMTATGGVSSTKSSGSYNSETQFATKPSAKL